MPRLRIPLATLVALLVLPAAASAQQSGTIDRVEPYESKTSELVYLRVTAHGNPGPCSVGCSWTIDLYSLPASQPCSAIAGLQGPGSRSHAYLWSKSGSGPLTIQKEDAALERDDGAKQRICLLGPDDVVLAEREIDISSFARLTEPEAVGWLRESIAGCEEGDRCDRVRELFIRCARRSTSAFRCFARWRAKNKLTGVEKVTWLHHHFRVSATLDDTAGVSARGKYRVGKGDGRP